MWGTIVLAGGKSTRFIENKALVTLGDKPLLQHTIDKVFDLTHEVIVVIPKNDELKKYSSFLPSRVNILKDAKGELGPLEGMLIGMRSLHVEYTLVLPCDSPFIKLEILYYLLQMAQGEDAIVPKWPNGYIEPLHAVYKVKSAILATEIAIRRKETSVFDMVRLLDKVVYVNTDKLSKLDSELLTFFNVNTKKDLNTAEMLLRGLG